MGMRKSRSGFTIVELLIVIVVIGILAAITIVAYNGVQGRAYDTTVQNDLANVAKKIQLYQITNGSYPMGTSQMSTIDFKISKNAYGNHFDLTGTGSYYNLVYCWPNTTNPDKFALIASSKSGKMFTYSDGSVKEVPYNWTSGSGGACPRAGVTMDNGNNRDWFYANNAWVSYSGS